MPAVVDVCHARAAHAKAAVSNALDSEVKRSTSAIAVTIDILIAIVIVFISIAATASPVPPCLPHSVSSGHAVRQRVHPASQESISFV